MTTRYYYRYTSQRHAALYDEYDAVPRGSGSTSLYCAKHAVISETPKGVWLDVYGAKRFVLSTAHKHFACATQDEALKSFIARKKRHISILYAQAADAQKALDMAVDSLQRGFVRI